MTNSEKNRLKDRAFQVFGVFCTLIGLVVLAIFLVDAAAAIIVLLFITFMLNGIAVYLRNRQQKKVNW